MFNTSWLRWLLVGVLFWNGPARAGSGPPELFPEEFPNPPAPPDVQTVQASEDRIRSGQLLTSGGHLTSSNGRFQFFVQDDGNCVIYRLSPNQRQALWSTNTRGQNCRLALDAQGLLRLTDSSGSTLWQAGSSKGPGQYYLQMQEDGNLVLYLQQGQLLTPEWASQSSQK